MQRRTALIGALGAVATATGYIVASGDPIASAKTQMKTKTNTNSSHPSPAIFLAHGSPFLLQDGPWKDQLAGWARTMPQPEAILMVSAHWTARPLTLGATTTVPLVYDFFGFPDDFYRVRYPAPGAPALARRVRELAATLGPVADDPARGLDHGAYLPLICMYPEAGIPVLQVSIPAEDPAKLFALGRALAPLRDENVLIVGSGFMTHNLRAMDLREGAPTPRWAQEFDAWNADVLARGDVDALLDYRRRAPGVERALPSHEHYLPLIVAAGANAEHGSAVQFPIEGFTWGSGAKRSVQFG